MFRKKFIYNYEYEGYCRACYNYWRHCDCIGDLFEDVCKPLKKEKEDDDDKDSSDIGTLVPYVTPSPKPLRPRQPTGTLDSTVTPAAKRPALGPSVLFPPEEIDGIPADDDDVFLGGDWVDDAMSDITDSLGTPSEINGSIVDGDNKAPVGAVYTLPPLHDLGMGYKPYSQSRIPAATLLQSSGNVPQFYGQGPTWPSINSGGPLEPTQEYTDWYNNTFVPWYNTSATPDEKHWLSGIKCLEPGPELGVRDWLGLPNITLVHFERKTGDVYRWDINGKTFHKKGECPSNLELWFPERFPGVITDEGPAVKTTRSMKRPSYMAGSTLSVKPDYRAMSTLVDPKQYVFPDSVETSIYNTSILYLPDPVLDTTYQNNTIQSGIGTELRMFHAKGVFNPNLYKFATVQLALGNATLNPFPVTEDYNIIQTDALALPFFGSNEVKLSRQGPGNFIKLIVYNHMKTGINPCHGMCKIKFRLAPRAGQTAIQFFTRVRLVNSTSTTTRITRNFPDSVADIVFGATNNTFENFSGSTTGFFEFGVYIPPTDNARFSIKPYLIFDISIEPGNGCDFIVDEVATFKNVLTITPSFEPDQLVSTTVGFNNLGTNLFVNNEGRSDACTKLGEFSDVNGVNILGLFSKMWYRTKDEPFTMVSASRQHLIQKVNSRNGIWSIYPLIGQIWNGDNFVPQSVVININNPSNQSIRLVYRVQHLNISNIWVN